MKVWYFLLQFSIYFSLILCLQFQNKQLGFCTEQQEEDLATMAATLGGLKDSSASSQNSLELLDGLARFAVEEHNKKEVLIYFYFFI